VTAACSSSGNAAISGVTAGPASVTNALAAIENEAKYQ
jgi:hypothetical protein